MVAIYIGFAFLFWIGILASPRIAFFVFLFLYSTYSRFFAVGVGELGFALSIQFLTGFSLVVAWGLLWVLRDQRVKEGVARLRAYPVVAGAALSIFVSKVVATLVQAELRPSVLSALLNDFLFSIGVLLVAVTVLRTRRDVVSAAAVVVGSLVFNEAWVLAEKIKGGALLADYVEITYKVVGAMTEEGKFRDTGYRVMGSFTNPLLLSSFVCITLPLAFFLLRRQVRLLRLVAVVLAFPTVVWTLSRSGVLTLTAIIGAFALFTFYRRTRVGRTLRGIIFVAVIGIGSLGALALLDFANQATMKESVSVSEDNSALYRLAQYVIVVELLSESPRRMILGFGMQRNMVEELDSLVNLDNYFLRVALESGLLGIACLLFFGGASWHLITRMSSGSSKRVGDEFEAEFALAAKLHLVAVFVTMVFVSVPYNFIYLYLVVGMALAILQPSSASLTVSTSAPPSFRT